MRLPQKRCVRGRRRQPQGLLLSEAGKVSEQTLNIWGPCSPSGWLRPPGWEVSLFMLIDTCVGHEVGIIKPTAEGECGGGG